MADIANKLSEIESSATIEKRITVARAELDLAITRYNAGAKELKTAAEAKAKCSSKYAVKPNAKNAKNLESATATYDAAYSNATEAYTFISNTTASLNEDCEKLVSEIALLKGSRAARKEEKKIAAAMNLVNAKKAKGDAILAQAGIKLEVTKKERTDIAKESAVAPSFSAQEAQSVQYASVAAAPIYFDPYAQVRPNVNIAPVNIDISTAVERVVNQAISKLSSALDQKMNEFFAAYNTQNVPQAQTASVSSSDEGASVAVLELEERIADNEKKLFDKLSLLFETVNALGESIAAVTEGYAKLDEKIKEGVELQRQTNDMQRHTQREQQGVQVNQRVINKDQLSISEEQAAIADAQNGIAEDQKRLATAQSAIAENQRAIVETQNSLNEAMDIVMQEQKKLIDAQQAIALENGKQLDAQRLIAEKQAEVSDIQKQMLSSQKSIIKEQRSAAERQNETEQLQKDALESVKEILKEQKSISAKLSKKSES